VDVEDDVEEEDLGEAHDEGGDLARETEAIEGDEGGVDAIDEDSELIADA
jgi:hypothetical protein